MGKPRGKGRSVKHKPKLRKKKRDAGGGSGRPRGALMGLRGGFKGAVSGGGGSRVLDVALWVVACGALFFFAYRQCG